MRDDAGDRIITKLMQNTEEDDAVDDNFVEASLIASLKSEVASLQKRIEDLEKQNNLLQNCKCLLVNNLILFLNSPS